MIQIKAGGFETTVDYYDLPAGEIQLVVGTLQDWLGSAKQAHVLARLHNPADILQLVFLDELLSRRKIEWDLTLPYVPYGRQDRVPKSSGESFTLKAFSKIINGLTHQSATIFDPHSDVTPALLERVVVVPQEELTPVFPKDTVLIAPDGGSLKKVYKVAARGDNKVVVAQKHRNELTGTILDLSIDMPEVENAVIVDDICDGGRTFIELGKRVRSKVKKSLSLYVTHGIFSQGIGVFEGIFDRIYTVDTYYDASSQLDIFSAYCVKSDLDTVILDHVARFFALKGLFDK